MNDLSAAEARKITNNVQNKRTDKLLEEILAKIRISAEAGKDHVVVERKLTTPLVIYALKKLQYGIIEKWKTEDDTKIFW